MTQNQRTNHMKLVTFAADLTLAYARFQMCFQQLSASHELIDLTSMIGTHGPASIDMDGYADEWNLGTSEEEGGWYLLFTVENGDGGEDYRFPLPLPQESVLTNLPDVFSLRNNVLHDSIGGGDTEWIQVAGPTLSHTPPRAPRLTIFNNCVKLDETGQHNPRSYVRTKTLVESTLDA